MVNVHGGDIGLLVSENFTGSDQKGVLVIDSTQSPADSTCTGLTDEEKPTPDSEQLPNPFKAKYSVPAFGNVERQPKRR